MKKKRHQLQGIDERIFRYWQALYLSFYSNRLYIDVVKRWKGLGITYLLLLMSVVCLPLALRVSLDFNEYFREKIEKPFQLLPTLFVHQGEVRFDVPLPHYIKDETGRVIDILDDHEDQSKWNQQYPNWIIAVTKNTLYFRSPQFNSFLSPNRSIGRQEVQDSQFDETDSMVFDSKQWMKDHHTDRLKYLMEVMIYPMLVAFFWGLLMTMFLAMAMMTQTVAWLIFKCTLSYQQASRLLIMVSTPSIVLLFLLLSTSTLFVGVGLVLLALEVFYFSYGLLAFRRERQALVYS